MGVPAGPTTFDPDTDGLPDVLAASRLPKGGAGRVVALLSTDLPGDDDWARRSAASVARGWARTGVRVFLADLSLEEPHLHETLGQENGEGVTDMFRFGTSVQRVARRIDGLPFFFAAAGAPTWNPGEILASRRWGQLSEGFKEAGAALLLYVPASMPGALAILGRASEALILGDEVPGLLAEAEGLSVVAWVSESGTAPQAAAPQADVQGRDAPPDAREAAPGEETSASETDLGGWAPLDDWSESDTQEWEIDGEAGAGKHAPPDRDPWGLGDGDLLSGEGGVADEAGVEATTDEADGLPDAEPVLETDPGSDEHALEGIAPDPETLAEDPATPEPGGGPPRDEDALTGDVGWHGEGRLGDGAPEDLAEDVPEDDVDLVAGTDLARGGASESTLPPDRPDAVEGAPGDVATPAPAELDPVSAALAGAPDADRQPEAPPAKARSAAGTAADRRAPRRSRRWVVWGGLVAALILGGYRLWDSGLIGGGAGGAGGEPPAGAEDDGGVDALEEGAASTSPGPQGATPAPEGATPAEEAGGDPGEPTSPVQGASLVLQSFPDRSQAQALADQLSESLGDFLFIVVPSTVGGATWYRTVAGPARDLTEIPGIRERIENADLPTLTGSSGWFPRVTELAFLLEETATIEEADRAAARYREQGIPAYVLAIDYSAGPRRYRVYAGGYAFANESAPLAEAIRATGQTPNLVQRLGSMPRSRAPR